MKRIALIAAILLICAGVWAATESQTANISGSYRGKVGTRDTITNAETDTTFINLTGDRADFTIQVDLYKISGTVAGTVKYFYSINGGLTWYLAETDNLSDASGTFTYEKNYLPANAWAVVVATTGTSSASDEVWVRTNK